MFPTALEGFEAVRRYGPSNGGAHGTPTMDAPAVTVVVVERAIRGRVTHRRGDRKEARAGFEPGLAGGDPEGSCARFVAGSSSVGETGRSGRKIRLTRGVLGHP